MLNGRGRGIGLEKGKGSYWTNWRKVKIENVSVTGIVIKPFRSCIQDSISDHGVLGLNLLNLNQLKPLLILGEAKSIPT